MLQQAVRMTPLQTEQLLLWRAEHLRNMHAIYEQRQQLNLQVCSTLSLPSPCVACTTGHAYKFVQVIVCIPGCTCCAAFVGMLAG